MAELGAVARQDHPVAVFKIGQRVGERRQRQRVGAKIHLALAVAHRQRRALPRADEQILLAVKQKGQREGAAQLRQRGGHRLDRCLAARHFFGDEMHDDFRVGLRLERVALAP